VSAGMTQTTLGKTKETMTMCDLRNAPVAVVPSHAWDVVERWLKTEPSRSLHYRGAWVALDPVDIGGPLADVIAYRGATIHELAGKLRGGVSKYREPPL
jgi:hypothetical protein